MTRVRLADVACSNARATDLFGDAWTALIMRDVMAGVNRFDDLARDLGISHPPARRPPVRQRGCRTRRRCAIIIDMITRKGGLRPGR
jgi:NADPH-dependent ferric siderophore reductase